MILHRYALQHKVEVSAIITFCFNIVLTRFTFLKTSGLVKNKLDIDKNEENGIYDHGDSAVNFCLEKRLGKQGKLDSQESLFEKNLNYGKMTVHRHHVTCKCRPGENCARVLPKREQGWTGYMGSMSNGYFVTRPLGRFHQSSSERTN